MVRNVCKMLKNRKAFTLVEVIVVAVIVAVLAAVAIPLYLGYVESSKVNVANNIAGSAASYLAAAKNSSAAGPFPDLVGNAQWAFTPVGAATPVTFTCPNGATIKLSVAYPGPGIVTCVNDGHPSTGVYSY